MTKHVRDRASGPVIAFNPKFKLGDPMIRTVKVSGKKVTFKDKYPVAESKKLSKALASAMDGDADKVINLLTYVISDWDFEGDPSDPDAYKTEDMDYLRHVWPMYLKFNTYASELGDLDDLKN